MTNENNVFPYFLEEKAHLFAIKKHMGQKDDQGSDYIKFADRLSNLSRMDSWPEKRQQHYLKKSKFWKSE